MKPRGIGPLAEEQAGASLQGPPFSQTVYEIVNHAATGKRLEGRGEGELIPPPSLSRSVLLSKLKC